MARALYFSTPLTLGILRLGPDGTELSSSILAQNTLSQDHRHATLDISTVAGIDCCPSDDRYQILSAQLFWGNPHRQVTISAWDLKALVPTTFFVWDHLVHLTLRCRDEANRADGMHRIGATPYTAHRLLQGCTNLISFQFHLDDDEDDILRGAPLSLPVLESLIILDYSDVVPQALADVVEHLTMPNLKRFHLPTENPCSLITDTAFLVRLAERSPLISDLSFDLSMFTADSLAHILPRFASLDALGATHWISGNCSNLVDLLTILTPTSIISHPCPGLQELRLTDYHDLADHIWLEFLHTQVDRGTRLRRCKITYRADPPDILPDHDIALLRIRGLDVAVMYNPPSPNPDRTPWGGL
ncbi:hypothetical protein DFH06DRAFT_1416641 [Mycena polygramma]|nr:hypothetical protein DFH06DRAFT_1416641 [Mycena polygramma]